MTNKGPKTAKGRMRKLMTGDGRKSTPTEKAMNIQKEITKNVMNGQKGIIDDVVYGKKRKQVKRKK
jgi:hypothetical protein